jgi:hypothetical protein
VHEPGGGIIEVLWTGGDAFLGGDDFDRTLASWLLDELIATAPPAVAEASPDALTGLKRNQEVMSRVLAEARKAKVRLSSARSADVVVSEVLPGLDLNVSVTQRQLEQRCEKLLLLLAQPIRQVALMAGIELQGDDTALSELAAGADPAASAALRAAQGGEISEDEIKALKSSQKSGARQLQKRRKADGQSGRGRGRGCWGQRDGERQRACTRVQEGVPGARCSCAARLNPHPLLLLWLALCKPSSLTLESRPWTPHPPRL